MALQTLPLHIRWPGLVQSATAPSISASGGGTLDAAGEYSSYIMQATEDMVVSHVGFRPGTVAGSPTADVRIETVGTDGLPTGTLWATDTNIVTATLVTNTWAVHALTAAATITKGQIYCVKIAYNAGTSIQLSCLTLRYIHGAGRPYVVNNTGTPAKGLWLENYIVALGSSSTTFYRIPGFLAVNAYTVTSFTNASAGNERGLRFKVPFKCRCAGIRDYQHNSIGDFDVVLRDDAGSSLSSISFDGDLTAVTTPSMNFAFFTTPVELAPDTWYRVGKVPTSGTNVMDATVTFPSVALAQSSPWGENAHLYTYTTGGGFVDSATDQITLIDVLIDQLDDGVSAGGVTTRVIGG